MEYDAVVAGAGPVGLFLACELGLLGVRTAVVEQLENNNIPTRGPGLGGRALNIPSMEAFYRRGLMDEVRNAVAMWFGPPERKGDASAEDAVVKPRFRFAGHFAGIMLDADLIDYGDVEFTERGPAAAGCLIDLVSLENLLAKRACDLGVTIRRGVALTGFEQDETGVTITTSGERVRAAWLVACDGGRSKVRKLGGFAFPGTPPEITAYSAMVEIADPEKLTLGWNRTANGIYVFGPFPNRLLVVEFKGPPADRDTPVTADEVQESLRHVSGTDATIAKVFAVTRFTDNARQATSYRSGRVLLAGDAAHVHSPFGGQGMNLGIGDAMNLGWKLASVIKGWRGEELLDTYTAERHPIAAWALEWTRAQIAIMRPEAHARAMGNITKDLIGTSAGATYFAKCISGVWQRYDPGSGHPLVGKSAPDLLYRDGSRLGTYLQTGQAVVFESVNSPCEEADEQQERFRLIRKYCMEPPPTRMLLLRPDGYIAWAGDFPDDRYREALRKWVGSVPVTECV